MSGEITSLEFSYAADAADERQVVRYTLADVLKQARPERAQELLDDLRAVAESFTAAEAQAHAARRGRLGVVPGDRSSRDLP